MEIADAINKLSCIYYNATLSLAEAKAYRILCNLSELKNIQYDSFQYLIILKRLSTCIDDTYMCEVEDYITAINKSNIYSCLTTSQCTNLIEKICNVIITDVTPFPVCVDTQITEL